MEGITDYDQTISKCNRTDSSKQGIMYAGALYKRFGVELLTAYMHPITMMYGRRLKRRFSISLPRVALCNILSDASRHSNTPTPTRSISAILKSLYSSRRSKISATTRGLTWWYLPFTRQKAENSTMCICLSPIHHDSRPNCSDAGMWA